MNKKDEELNPASFIGCVIFLLISIGILWQYVGLILFIVAILVLITVGLIKIKDKKREKELAESNMRTRKYLERKKSEEEYKEKYLKVIKCEFCGEEIKYPYDYCNLCCWVKEKQ